MRVSKTQLQLFIFTCVTSVAGLGTQQALAAGGDPEAGAKLITACQACHGADGNGVAPNYPNHRRPERALPVSPTADDSGWHP